MTAAGSVGGARSSALAAATSDQECSKAVLQTMYDAAPSVGSKPYAEDFQKAVIEITPLEGMESFLANFDLSKRALPPQYRFDSALSLLVPGCCVLYDNQPTSAVPGGGSKPKEKSASNNKKKRSHSVVMAAGPAASKPAKPRSRKAEVPTPSHSSSSPSASPQLPALPPVIDTGAKSRVCQLSFSYPTAWKRSHDTILYSAARRSKHGHQPLRAMVIGAKGAGKSTFGRMLVNRLLSAVEGVAYLDLDVGQPELGLPGTVSLSIVKEPLLTPPYYRCNGSGSLSRVGATEAIAHSSAGAGEAETSDCNSGGNSIVAMRYFGDASVASDPGLFMSCARELFDIYRGTITMASLPLVVNAHGWLKGFGYETLQDAIGHIKPTDLVFLDSSAGQYATAPAAESEEDEGDDSDGELGSGGARDLYASLTAPFLLQGAPQQQQQQQKPQQYVPPPPVAIAPWEAVEAMTNEYGPSKPSTGSPASTAMLDRGTMMLLDNARRRERFILPSFASSTEVLSSSSSLSSSSAGGYPRVHHLRAWHAVAAAAPKPEASTSSSSGKNARHETLPLEQSKPKKVTLLASKTGKGGKGGRSKPSLSAEEPVLVEPEELTESAAPALAAALSKEEQDEEKVVGEPESEADEEGSSPTYDDGDSDDGAGEEVETATAAGPEPLPDSPLEESPAHVGKKADASAEFIAQKVGRGDAGGDNNEDDGDDDDVDDDEDGGPQQPLLNLPPPRAARSPSDLRAQRLLNYFLHGAVLSLKRGLSGGGDGDEDSERSSYLLACAVYRAAMSDHKIARAPSAGSFSPAFVFGSLAVPLVVPAQDVVLATSASAHVSLAEDCPASAMTAAALSVAAQGFEGQVVGLCSRELFMRHRGGGISGAPSSSSSSSSSSARTPPPAAVAAGLLPCIGLAYVRSYDRIAQELHLLTPLALEQVADAGVDVLVSWRPAGSGGSSGGHDMPLTLLYRAGPHGDPFTCDSADLKNVKQTAAAASGKPQRKNLKRARLLP